MHPRSLSDRCAAMTDKAGISDQPLGERLVGAAGAAVVVGLLGAGLIWGLAASRTTSVEKTSALLDFRTPPTPPIHLAPHVRSKAAAGRSAPPNLKNKATPVVAAPPVVRLPPPPPTVIVASRPGTGAAAQTGASDHLGPGQGAGGAGDGTGGGDGSGDGGGDDPPRQIKGRLKYSDLPPDLRETGIGGAVGVRYRVRTDGHVDECSITRSSGNAELDALTCPLIERRFRFRPSTTADGQAVDSFIVETHSWVVDRDDETSPRS